MARRASCLILAAFLLYWAPFQRQTARDAISALGYGAIPDDGLDDTVGLQAALDAAIASCGRLKIPAGDYHVTTLDPRNMHPVTNAGGFGVQIQGEGMGTRLIHAVDTGHMLELDAGETDLQYTISDLQLVSGSGVGGTDVAINVGKANRYSKLSNIRIYGFQVGIRFNRMTQGFRLEDVSIRGAGRWAVVSRATASNLSTTWQGGVIDNNGVESYNGGPQYPALYFYQWGASTVRDLIVEGNFAGSFAVHGCRELRFDNDRFEETCPRWSPVGNLSEIGQSSIKTSFRNCYFAYPGLRFRLMTVASSVLLDNCPIDDTNLSGRSPFNVFGAPALVIR